VEEAEGSYKKYRTLSLHHQNFTEGREEESYFQGGD